MLHQGSHTSPNSSQAKTWLLWAIFILRALKMGFPPELAWENSGLDPDSAGSPSLGSRLRVEGPPAFRDKPCVHPSPSSPLTERIFLITNFHKQVHKTPINDEKHHLGLCSTDKHKLSESSP
ncbi:hypothetical protein B0T16DRAFT_414845 [Cercophora newfieldiana]|uniref:Uncharacterized protein n=1 Tax=Cercophora newfieldiana TaxID=92897 RepID=A0AA39Y8Y4_9PEZI|nr:hypothetical protein B0T16DRAFT_414845 [Cercophora newfieldiana]